MRVPLFAFSAGKGGGGGVGPRWQGLRVAILSGFRVSGIGFRVAACPLNTPTSRGCDPIRV